MPVYPATNTPTNLPSQQARSPAAANMADVSQFMGRLMPALMPRDAPPPRMAVRVMWVPTSEEEQAVSTDTASRVCGVRKGKKLRGRPTTPGEQGA